MRSQGVYGQKLGDHFQLESAPSIVTTSLKRSEIGITHIRCQRPSLTSPIPTEDAYLVAFQVEDCLEHELWINGRGSGRLPLFAGQTSIYDLRVDPIAFVRETSNCVMYYLPKAAFDTLAEENGAIFSELNAHEGRPTDDPVVASLSAAILPAFQTPEYASQLFLDHLALAVATHLAGGYGDLRILEKGMPTGLTQKMERRAKELIDANIAGEVPLAQIARECGMSARHFVSAFKQTVGVAPHQWMVLRRCERAKDLLRSTSLTLGEIAHACGFADQSHFTRSFARLVFATPGAYRRSLWEVST
ncbi:transcriptional regulator [Rhizobium sp. Root708]|uniref:helix-turn-helix domain-containing protein n=1 Tax=Rhizobium sp. Root708 TaxID=1736592 RepID=UPI0006F810D0|nr:AraC family transcriptional regulator [Rhizobium sp. Root708]KRB50689.1 transcriptional regulator [Rhizobium sp. Root708]